MPSLTCLLCRLRADSLASIAYNASVDNEVQSALTWLTDDKICYFYGMCVYPSYQNHQMIYTLFASRVYDLGWSVPSIGDFSTYLNGFDQLPYNVRVYVRLCFLELLRALAAHAVVGLFRQWLTIHTMFLMDNAATAAADDDDDDAECAVMAALA